MKTGRMSTSFVAEVARRALDASGGPQTGATRILSARSSSGDQPTKERPGRERPIRERPIRERPIRERPVRERQIRDPAREADAPQLGALEVSDTMLGEGANGKVWAAKFGPQRSAVAAKVVKKTNLNAQELIELRNEIELHKRLRHPNIVTLHGAFEDPAQVTIVLSLCRGGSLFDTMVRAHQEESDGLPEPKAREAFAQLLCALRHCHRHGIVHRDVCLRNLCWADEAETKLQLVDFGYATTEVHHATFVGSVHFAAPEVRKREQGYGGVAHDRASVGWRRGSVHVRVAG